MDGNAACDFLHAGSNQEQTVCDVRGCEGQSKEDNRDVRLTRHRMSNEESTKAAE